VDTVTYGCWEKATLTQIGGFDETLVRNQDDELNLRLVLRGGKVWQNPNIRSWYSPRATLTALFKQYFQYGFWKVAVIKKHGAFGSWRHLAPAVFASANILFALAVSISTISGAISAATLFALLWLLMLVLYFSLALTFSVAAAKEHGWELFPYLPLVFVTYHFSYGAGFLGGLYRFRSSAPIAVAPDSVFTRLSR
jgi:succinoglycan biosynthesis protein ExoA